MQQLRELMDMTGRVAIITGGAGHIGMAMAEALANLVLNFCYSTLTKSDYEKC